MIVIDTRKNVRIKHMEKDSQIICLLRKATGISKYRDEVIIDFEGLDSSELIPFSQKIIEGSIVSDKNSTFEKEGFQTGTKISRISIKSEDIGYPGIDISVSLMDYCQKLQNKFIHKGYLEVIQEPLMISAPEAPLDIINEINVKKHWFDLISNLADDKSRNIIFYAERMLRIDNYLFSYEIEKLFSKKTAEAILSYFNLDDGDCEAKRNCFKEEILEVLANISKEDRCYEFFKHLDEIFINTKARYGRYVRRTSETSINSSLKNITEKYLPLLSTSIQTMTADIMALVGNIVLLSNIDFANPLTASNTVFLFISALFDLLFSYLLYSRRKNITFICDELLETEKELKEYNPNNIQKIAEKIKKLKDQADYTKSLFAIMILFIWIPIIVAGIALYAPLALHIEPEIAHPIYVRIIPSDSPLNSPATL